MLPSYARRTALCGSAEGFSARLQRLLLAECRRRESCGCLDFSRPANVKAGQRPIQRVAVHPKFGSGIKLNAIVRIHNVDDVCPLESAECKLVGNSIAGRLLGG